MAHSPKYLNKILIPRAVCVWPHLFQPRDFRNDGNFRYDCGLLLSQEQMSQIYNPILELAQQAFPQGQWQQEGFQWPMTPTEKKINSPKLAEVFPGHYLITGKAYPESPPQVLIQTGADQYVEMPDELKSKWVYDGAICAALLDFASFHTGQNPGIRVQLGAILFGGQGEHVTIGARADGKKEFGAAGINVGMYGGPTPNMTPGTQQPGMQTQQPGMQPGMQTQQPGMQPGMQTQQPGMQPGMQTQQPGMQPGMQTQQPGMQPGMQTQQPGLNMQSGNPGEMPPPPFEDQ